MKPVLTKTDIFDQSKTEEILLNHNVLEIKDLGEGKELVTYEVSPDLEKFNEKKDMESYVTKKLSAESQSSHFDINVAISLFISSYARIHIFSLIYKYKLNCYYMDTDSLVIDRSLPESEVGSELGKLKLEYIIRRGLHASPKLYWHLPLHSYIPIVKAKGAGKNISYEEFSKLIKLESISYVKEKWFRTVRNINVKDVTLRISGGTSKRRMIVKNGIWIGTEPLKITEISKNSKLIISSSQDL